MFGLGSFSNDIFSLSNRIRRDVERSLNREFSRWDLLEHDPVSFDPNHTSYRMKILTNDNGHVRVKTVKKDPGHDWETHIEEYDRGYALEQPQRQALQQEPLQNQGQQTQPGVQQQQQQSSLDHSHQQGQELQHKQSQHQHQQQQQSGSTDIQSQQQNPQQSLEQYRSTDVMDIEHDITSIANSIKNDIESSLGQFFHRWDVFDYTPLWFDPEHTSYRMKILTDNNGHVNVRTTRKDPGQPWQTRIEEFYNNKHPLTERSKQKSLQGQGQAQSQTQRQNQGQQQGLNQGLNQERKGAGADSQDKPAEQRTATADS